MSDRDFDDIIDKNFKKVSTTKGTQYQYAFFRPNDVLAYVVRALGITNNFGGELNVQRIKLSALEIIRRLRGARVVDVLGSDVPYVNFLFLANYNNITAGDKTVQAVTTRLNNLFAPYVYAQIDGIYYAIPRFLFIEEDQGNNTFTYTLRDEYELFNIITTMIIFIMRNIQGNEKGVSVLKLRDWQEYNYPQTTDSMLIGRTQEPNTGNKYKNPYTNIPPAIQPETGQTEATKPDENIKQFNAVMTGDVETPEDDFTPPPDPDQEELEELFSDQLNPQPAIGVTQEQLTVADPNEVVASVLNQIAEIAPEVAQNVAPQLQVNQPILAQQLPQLANPPIVDLVSGGADFFPFMDVDDEDLEPTRRQVPQADRVAIRELLNFNRPIIINDQVNDLFSNFTQGVMSIFRGNANVVAIGVVENLSGSVDTLKLMMTQLIDDIDIYCNILGNSIVDRMNFNTFLISVPFAAIIVRETLKVLAGKLFDLLGLTTFTVYNQPNINVERIRVIKDMNGKTLNIIREGEVNFFPDPISNQTAYDFINNPDGYVVTRILPSGDRFDIIKSQFDVGLYNFIGNRLLSISELNQEPTYLQPSYSLLTNISTEVDDLYTTITTMPKEVSMQKLKEFLPIYQQFLVKNKKIFTNFVNQSYDPPDPDDDPEDDDAGSGPFQGGLPDKKGKFVDSQEGEWYTMKTLIYWIMRHLSKTYEYTSVHMQNLFLVSYEIANDIFTSIVGRHPYLTSATAAIVLLRPQFMPEIIDTFVVVFSSILSMTKSVFAFFSSTAGMVLLAGGLGVLAYAFAKSEKKFSIF
jgi:hypothetical protein